MIQLKKRSIFQVYKSLYSTILLLFPTIMIGQIQLSNGVHWVSEGNVQFQVHGLDIINNATFDAGSNSILRINAITPSTGIHIQGNSSTTFHRLEINNTSDTVFLDQNILIVDTLEMISGVFDLNKFNIDLGMTGEIKGEDAACHISGKDGGVISKTIDLNAPAEIDPGNLGIEITSGANLGLTTISRGHLEQSSTGGGYGINRYFDISPANNTGLNAALKFHYMDGELNSINEVDLDFFRSTDNGVSWTIEGYNNLNTIDNWIELSGIDGFSRWTIGSNKNNVLPVELLEFTAECLEGKTLITWITGSETNHHYFLLQFSSDGNNWENLEWINGEGNETSGKKYEQIVKQSTGYFRIKSVAHDEEVEYSNVITSDCNQHVVIQVYPNLIKDYFIVDIINPDESTIKMNLLNAQGISIKEMLVPPFDNQQSYLYPMVNHPPGNYYLQIQQGNKITQVIKMIKLQM